MIVASGEKSCRSDITAVAVCQKGTVKAQNKSIRMSSAAPPPGKKCKTGTDHPNDDAALRAELDELKKKYDELEKKYDEVEKKYDEEKKEKDELQKKIDQTSLKTLVLMKEPLHLTERGSGKSHTGKTPKHKEAHMTKIGEKFKLASLFDSNFAQKITKDVWQNPSSLLVDFKDAEKAYSSEADVSRFVASALRDAAELASIVAGRKFELRHEMSFFSQRPDHLVVFDLDSNVPLIAVEDKKPFDGNLEDANVVLGQLFDYTAAMKAFGHATPFVILTTFEKSSMFWLADSKSNDIATDVPGILERSFGQAVSAEPGLSATGAKKKTPSPPDLKSESLENMEGIMFSAADGGDRKLIGTEEYQSNRLVQLMYTAILCGAAANPCAEKKHEIRSLQAGKWYKGGALEMTSDDYSWGTLQAEVGKPIMKQLISQSGKSANATKGDCRYYVIGIIGAGDTSKVFHALDASGNECVIKMYAKRVDERKLTLTKKDFESKAEQATKREVDNYSLLYPEFGVKREMIYQHFCAVMPFFRPIPKGDRSKYLEAIGKEFERFAEKSRKYETSDVRWRHVGLYGEENKIVLFDLADLEEMLGENGEHVSSQHAKILKERIR